MLSSDKNIETLAQLIGHLRDYIGLQKEYLKLDVIEKVVQLISALTLAMVMVVLGVAVLCNLTFAVVFLMAPLTGTATAFLIVAVAFLAVLVLVFVYRKPWIERPLVRFLAKILLSE